MKRQLSLVALTTVSFKHLSTSFTWPISFTHLRGSRARSDRWQNRIPCMGARRAAADKFSLATAPWLSRTETRLQSIQKAWQQGKLVKSSLLNSSSSNSAFWASFSSPSPDVTSKGFPWKRRGNEHLSISNCSTRAALKVSTARGLAMRHRVLRNQAARDSGVCGNSRQQHMKALELHFSKTMLDSKRKKTQRFNPFTPDHKKYILPTFQRENVSVR